MSEYGHALEHPAGGCPQCGRSTTPVDVSDFGADGRGQLCPAHGVVAVI